MDVIGIKLNTNKEPHNMVWLDPDLL